MRIDWRSPTALACLVDAHLSRYPLMQPEDVYKLLYQGILGPEHLISSPEEFAARLQEEYDVVFPEDVEPLWEAVRPDGALGRVNLRPFKAKLGSPAALARACLETARQVWGAPQDLREAWATFVSLCQPGRWIVFSLPQVLELAVGLEERDYPAVHHSQRYAEAYRPSYRLVGREWICPCRRDGNAQHHKREPCSKTD